ncbi:hypothetical protein FHS95_002647 [Sphingomonas naasensis]|uniref:Uncharacterized protein n=1 Tax=Sphingomonas naasensis TaxID=1344951 RepID=A0A4S1WN67_9SPHN|nr:hypothetical protein [Sphingomonas naasensis]NIJ20955.1 hypothetical protein [Sphingomonas naasensis]TGX43340.1 hypothetical protein E5A74_09265 [Sphingomonas naasensis]
MADARIPFADPYRTDLVQSADHLLRAARAQGAECVEARFLRVPAADAGDALSRYRTQLEAGWKPVESAAPPLTRAGAWRNGDAWFAAAIADRPQGAWTGMVIVTNSYWDAPSRDALLRCRAAQGR